MKISPILISLFFAAYSAGAYSKSVANLQSLHRKDVRHTSGIATAPCSADIDRIKALAATSLEKMEIDSDGHKLAVTVESFKTSEVFATDANDGAVLSLGGTAKDPFGSDKIISIRAQALCSPATGKYELMSTEFQN